MEVEGSRCLRREQAYLFDQMPYYISDRTLLIQNAKDACSKNIRCIGIQFKKLDVVHNNALFSLCLDTIYSSSAYDIYNKSNSQVLKKVEGYGMCKYKSTIWYCIIFLVLLTITYW